MVGIGKQLGAKGQSPKGQLSRNMEILRVGYHKVDREVKPYKIEPSEIHREAKLHLVKRQ